MGIIATAPVLRPLDHEDTHRIATPASAWWAQQGLGVVNIGARKPLSDGGDLVSVSLSPGAARLLAAALLDRRSFRASSVTCCGSAWISAPKAHPATLAIITSEVLLHTALHADQPPALAAALTAAADLIEGRPAA